MAYGLKKDIGVERRTDCRVKRTERGVYRDTFSTYKWSESLNHRREKCVGQAPHAAKNNKNKDKKQRENKGGNKNKNGEWFRWCELRLGY